MSAESTRERVIFITGASGFMLGFFSRGLLCGGLDSMEYCASRKNLRLVEGAANFKFVKVA